jgi:hypothetical protein
VKVARATDRHLALLREYASVAWNDPDAQDRAAAIRALLAEVDDHRRRTQGELSQKDVMCRLNAAVRAAGGQTAFRLAHADPATGKMISASHLCEQMCAAEFGPLVLRATGVRKRTITVYEPIDREADPLPAARPIQAADHEGVPHAL